MRKYSSIKCSPFLYVIETDIQFVVDFFEIRFQFYDGTIGTIIMTVTLISKIKNRVTPL